MLLILLTIVPDLTTADTMTNVMLKARHIKLEVTKRVNQKTVKIYVQHILNQSSNC